MSVFIDLQYLFCIWQISCVDVCGGVSVCGYQFKEVPLNSWFAKRF